MNKLKILVVDDEQDICEILQFNLETEGYEVDTAIEALNSIKAPININYELERLGSLGSGNHYI